MKRFFSLIAFSGLLLAAGTRVAKADSFDVSLNTSSLSGTWALAFEFIDGDGVADNNLTLTGFSLGGGTVAAPADYLGTTGVSGDIASGIAMDDTSLGTAIFTQDFNPGSSLSFLLTTTNNLAGVTPDGFSMLLCDVGLDTCYSDDPDGALLELGLDGTSLSPSSFTTNGVSTIGLPAPVVTVGSSGNVPETSSLLLLAAALLALGAFQFRRVVSHYIEEV